jgi:hypothetical protein
MFSLGMTVSDNSAAMVRQWQLSRSMVGPENDAPDVPGHLHINLITLWYDAPVMQTAVDY